MSDPITFNIYGGPDAGKITQVEPGTATHRVGDYAYVLSKVAADRWAFVPADDVELRAAYQLTDGEPGNPEADALAAEIERRNLDL